MEKKMCVFLAASNLLATSPLCPLLSIRWRQHLCFFQPATISRAKIGPAWSGCELSYKRSYRSYIAERQSRGMWKLSKGRRRRKSRWRWNRSVSRYVLCLCPMTQETSQTFIQHLEAWFRCTLLQKLPRWNRGISAALLDTGTCVQSMWVSLRGSRVSAPLCACHTICRGSCFYLIKGA